MKKRYILVIIIILAVLLALAVFFVPKIIKYNKAVASQEAGDAEEAYALFVELGGWRDSDVRAARILAGNPSLQFASVQEWDTVTLGEYDQDGDADNGKEPIEWYAADVSGDEIILISCKCLDCMPYNEEVRAVTWEESSIRDFLNEDFYESAFTDSEKRIIKLFHNENEDNEMYGVSGGEDTDDHVFLLSEKQADVYFNNEEAKTFYKPAEPSKIAEIKGISISDDGTSPWWLRDPGNEDYSARFMEPDGSVYEAGAEVDIDRTYGIRPAICIRK